MGCAAGRDRQAISRAGALRGLGLGLLLFLFQAAFFAPAAESRDGWLGVQVSNLTLESAGARGHEGAGGILVLSVTPGGPAEAAGIEPGDIILAIDGVPMSRMKSLVSLVGARTPGKVVPLVALSQGRRKELSVTLGSKTEAARSVPSNDTLNADYERGAAAYDAGDPATTAGIMRELANYASAAPRFWMGFLYDEGSGLGPNPPLAAYWYRLAAETGSQGAQVNLGLLYEEGRGVPQDLLRAYYWFDAAASAGDDDAIGRRERVAASLSPAQRREAAAWKELVPEVDLDTLAKNAAPRPPVAKPQSAAAAPSVSRAALREIQQHLAALGYAPGPADGLMGGRTATAIRGFQEQAGLPATGQPDQALLARLRAAAPAPAAVSAPKPQAPAQTQSQPAADTLGDLNDLDDF